MSASPIEIVNISTKQTMPDAEQEVVVVSQWMKLQALKAVKFILKKYEVGIDKKQQTIVVSRGLTTYYKTDHDIMMLAAQLFKPETILKIVN